MVRLKEAGVMQKIENLTFKSEYKRCKTYGDFDRLIERMSRNSRDEMVYHMSFVNETTGLTMREEAFLFSLKASLR